MSHAFCRAVGAAGPLGNTAPRRRLRWPSGLSSSSTRSLGASPEKPGSLAESFSELRKGRRGLREFEDLVSPGPRVHSSSRSAASSCCRPQFFFSASCRRLSACSWASCTWSAAPASSAWPGSQPQGQLQLQPGRGLHLLQPSCLPLVVQRPGRSVWVPTFLKDSSSSAILVARACRQPLETFSLFTQLPSVSRYLPSSCCRLSCSRSSSSASRSCLLLSCRFSYCSWHRASSFPPARGRRPAPAAHAGRPPPSSAEPPEARPQATPCHWSQRHCGLS